MRHAYPFLSQPHPTPALGPLNSPHREESHISHQIHNLRSHITALQYI